MDFPILKINEAKTEACIFSRADIAAIDISVNGVHVRIRNVINVLGVLFDSKLRWDLKSNERCKKLKKH